MQKILKGGYTLELFNDLLKNVNDGIYTLLIPLLIIAGLYFTCRTKFVQFRLIGDAFKSLIEKADKGKVSSFKSLMISTAARIGVGHIAGIAAGIRIGGVGAIFWMWIMALIGSASAFVESTLAQVYKVKDSNGFRGGPSYYIEKALKQKWLGMVFAVLLIVGYAYGFNSLQSFQLTSALTPSIPDEYDGIFKLIVGIVLVLLTALVIWGGTHRIGFISMYIVPVMSIMYILLSIFIICKNIDKVPELFSDIFREAFNFKSMIGAGFYGGALMMGVKKGLFSNEAGMGSAPNAAATADVAHPVNQGLAQVLSVFIDTLIICSATDFIVTLPGVSFDLPLAEMPFVERCVSQEVGAWGMYVIAVSILAFAFTSIIGNYCYAETSFLFIKDDKTLLNIFRITCLIAVFFGTQTDARTVWGISDLFMGLMACVNIVVIMLIGGVAMKTLKDYTKQKKEGKIPRFKAKEAGVLNAEVWK